MRDKLRIPERIKVGFQKRDDTYTGKLGYVISGGRKKDPISWNNWRAKNIPPQEFDNTPIEGFVLNRDVGGTQRNYDWNARREKVRVFDPRDFEFEITVENVLLILQECSSIKGKGLEGQFVLAWSGSNVILLPVTSQEYKTSVEFMELGAKKVAKSDIQEGGTYLTKDKVNVMYLGRHAWFEEIPSYCYHRRQINRGEKKHIFLNLDQANQLHSKNRKRDCYFVETGFSKLAHKTSETPSPQYAEEYEKLQASQFISVPKELVVKPAKLKNIGNDSWYYAENIGLVDGDKVWFGLIQIDRDGNYWNSNAKPWKYTITCDGKLAIRNGELVHVDREQGKALVRKNLTEEEVKALAKDVYIKCENEAEYLYA